MYVSYLFVTHVNILKPVSFFPSFLEASYESVDIGNWTFESTHGTTASVWIAEGTTLYPGAYCTYTPHYGWLNNNNESLILRNVVGEEVYRTPVVSDTENDTRL